jgi:F-type H+-transporting ATPase subunit b
MPQLDPQYFAPQIIWTLLSFAVMYLILVKLAVPRISDVLLNRSQRIDSDLSEAEQLKREAETAHDNYEKALSEAKAKAHQIAQDMRDRLLAETNSLRAEMDARLEEAADAAEARIEAAKAAALGNVREIASDAAVAVVERLMGRSPAEAEVRKALDAVLETRGDVTLDKVEVA